MRFAFIAGHTAEFHITTMCRVLLVSKAGYYAWIKRPPSAQADANAQLTLDIAMVHEWSRGTYGSPRVHVELTATGATTSVNRIARLMQAEGIGVTPRRGFRVTTDSKHAHPIAPNTLDRQFAVASTDVLNQVWVGDITYLWTRDGWLYLAVVLDLASRRVIGWAMRHTLEGALTSDALTMALRGRRPAPGTLHHTDRGSQGGFNRTSQHLTNEVDDDKDRQAKIESFDTKQTVLTGSAPSFGQGGATAILGGD